MGHLCEFISQAWLGSLDIQVSEGSAMESLECLDSVFAVCDHLKGTQCVKSLTTLLIIPPFGRIISLSLLIR